MIHASMSMPALSAVDGKGCRGVPGDATTVADALLPALFDCGTYELTDPLK
jgi:hypothetical protein